MNEDERRRLTNLERSLEEVIQALMVAQAFSLRLAGVSQQMIDDHLRKQTAHWKARLGQLQGPVGEA
jgi:hypothetical protein